jgi:hypothetical protein
MLLAADWRCSGFAELRFLPRNRPLEKNAKRVICRTGVFLSGKASNPDPAKTFFAKRTPFVRRTR